MNDAGKVAGAFSGGCVDGEIALACDEVLTTGKPRSLRFGPDDSVLGTGGLVCGGEILVWMYQLSKELGRALSTAPEGQFVLSSNWSHDREQLRQLVIDRETAATMAKCRGVDDALGPDNQAGRAASFLLIDRKRTRLAALPTGETEFLERIGNRELALIIGESGFTDALCRLARLLDYEVVVCEPRRRFAASIVSADEVLGSWPNVCIEKLAAAGRLGAGSVIIVCTHDRKFDEPALLAAIRSSAGFIGALGSRRTREDRRARLLAAGLSEAEVSRIRSPIGIDLGSETPAETAVSVFAEIIAARNGRSGRALTELSGAIHGNHVGLHAHGG